MQDAVGEVADRADVVGGLERLQGSQGVPGAFGEVAVSNKAEARCSSIWAGPRAYRGE
jgi:hypothetical protein